MKLLTQGQNTTTVIGFTIPHSHYRYSATWGHEEPFLVTTLPNHTQCHTQHQRGSFDINEASLLPRSPQFLQSTLIHSRDICCASPCFSTKPQEPTTAGPPHCLLSQAKPQVTSLHYYNSFLWSVTTNKINFKTQWLISLCGPICR